MERAWFFGIFFVLAAGIGTTLCIEDRKNVRDREGVVEEVSNSLPDSSDSFNRDPVPSVSFSVPAEHHAYPPPSVQLAQQENDPDINHDLDGVPASLPTPDLPPLYDGSSAIGNADDSNSSPPVEEPNSSLHSGLIGTLGGSEESRR